MPALLPKLSAGRIEISAQNHNFAVDPETLPSEVEVSHAALLPCRWHFCAGAPLFMQ
jgi:hypothetical protein